MDDMRGVKRELKLAEWTNLLQQRTESGKTIEEWCQGNGIQTSIYYYWQRRVREAMAGSAIARRMDGVMEPMPSVASPEFARATMPGRKDPGPYPVMGIRIGSAECEIYSGADIGAVSQVLKILAEL